MRIPLSFCVALLTLELAAAHAQTTNVLQEKAADNPASSIAGPIPREAPPLTHCLKIEQDPVGKALQQTFVWTDLPRDTQGVAIGFRKTFDLDSKPSSAFVHLFADARYILWVNGTYVDRGPARFQPNGPEYDTIDIARYLKKGKNAVAMLVAGNLSGGKVMRHIPGVTASLNVGDKSLWKTDATWRWSDRTRYRKTSADWANLGDTVVDAQVEDGDWTSAEYDDATWKPALAVSGSDWGPLTARRIPMMNEKEVPFTLQDGASLPVILKQGQKLEFTTGRIVQAYPVLSLTADAGTELSIEPYGVHYTAKAGPQTHFTLDTRGITRGVISVTKGSSTITGLKIIERLYPYERLASFQSDDPFLNRLWEMCARSCEVLSEDSYVDCADRERVEWMDNTPPGYDITRTAMSGPAGIEGKKVYSDPRLLHELIRRTALTLQPDGWVKAHTCSDRYDIHAKMEDRACDWVEGIRLYYEATGNTAAVREIWPAVTTQMDYFLEKRTAKGLVSARDWVVWSNPTGYLVGQTTPLNCFVYRALSEASVLAGIVGDAEAARSYKKAAADLKQAINLELWDQKSGSYFGGYFDEGEASTIASSKPKVAAQLKEGYFPPTLEANLFALDRGVVPQERRKRVMDAVMEQEGKANIGRGIMTAYYLYKQLYALDENANDKLVLDLIRRKFQAMVDSPLQCSWEGYSGGSKAHIYGMYPGYFLSAYVLGVRRDAPVSQKRLLIEPHLADLKKAKGTVVTEFGPVSVSWSNEGATLHGEITLPGGATTTLALPSMNGEYSILIDGKRVKGKQVGNRLRTPISPGKHTIIH
jgi:alpha-L-rhamnosidase